MQTLKMWRHRESGGIHPSPETPWTVLRIDDQGELTSRSETGRRVYTVLQVKAFAEYERYVITSPAHVAGGVQFGHLADADDYRADED